MSSVPPFDPSTLETESETRTRARNRAIEWSPGPSRAVFNDDYELDPAFATRVPSGARWDRFDEAYDDLAVDVTLMERGILFGEGMLVCDACRPTLSAERLYLVSLKRIAHRLRRYGRLNVPSGPVYLVGGNSGHRNHYHWIFQCLPAILLLRGMARERGLDYRIVLPPIGPRPQASLALAGIEASECVVLEPDSFLQDVPLMYTSVASSRYTFQPSAAVIGVLDGYRDACLERGDPALPTRFYVSRKDAPGKRELENEADLVRALGAHGHDELVLSDLSMEDQVSAFARAESIVAPHGAGLVNLVFAPAGARLVEIMPAHYRYAYFFRLAQARGMGYAEVMAHVVREDADEPQANNVLNVEVARVLAALKRSELARGKRAARAA